MSHNDHIIDIEEARRPYNCYLTLPLVQLQQLAPLLKEEILKGLVETDSTDRVVLHLLLSPAKIKQLKQIASSFRSRSAVEKK
jgi:hypothetical protein